MSQVSSTRLSKKVLLILTGSEVNLQSSNPALSLNSSKCNSRKKLLRILESIVPALHSILSVSRKLTPQTRTSLLTGKSILGHKERVKACRMLILDFAKAMALHISIRNSQDGLDSSTLKGYLILHRSAIQRR